MTRLELLKLALLDMLNPVTFRAVSLGDGSVRIEQGDLNERKTGRDWPASATTMIGYDRMTNIETLIWQVLNDEAGEVEGDYIETGVWRGGAAIYARECLSEFGAPERLIFACDSFQGLPQPDAEQFPADYGDLHHTVGFLAVTREEVEANFHRFGTGVDGVRFVEGWFRDTLPTLTDQRFSVVRLDGDMYESTMIGLRSLYPHLSEGGFLIVDDYGAVKGCREAVDNFRQKEGITSPLTRIDWTGAYWRKGGEG